MDGAREARARANASANKGCKGGTLERGGPEDDSSPAEKQVRSKRHRVLRGCFRAKMVDRKVSAEAQACNQNDVGHCDVGH